MEMAVEIGASRTMHRMVCVSDDVARFCQKRIGIAQSKLLVIPDGVETTAVRLTRRSSSWE
jgi:hypothetical protein